MKISIETHGEKLTLELDEGITWVEVLGKVAYILRIQGYSFDDKQLVFQLAEHLDVTVAGDEELTNAYAEGHDDCLESINRDIVTDGSKVVRDSGNFDRQYRLEPTSIPTHCYGGSYQAVREGDEIL